MAQLESLQTSFHDAKEVVVEQFERIDLDAKLAYSASSDGNLEQGKDRHFERVQQDQANTRSAQSSELEECTDRQENLCKRQLDSELDAALLRRYARYTPDRTRLDQRGAT